MDLKEKAEQIARECCTPVTAEDYNHYIASIEKALEEASTKDTKRLDFLEENITKLEAKSENFGDFEFTMNREVYHNSLRDAIDDERANSSNKWEIDIFEYDKIIKNTVAVLVRNDEKMTIVNPTRKEIDAIINTLNKFE